MVMRSKFVGKDDSIHCYEVQWDPKKLCWVRKTVLCIHIYHCLYDNYSLTMHIILQESFRGELLGPTDPNECPEGSIRKAILDNYKELGLTSVPNKGDNGVDASASPFEGLAEKW